jgi:hypothetical protein
MTTKTQGAGSHELAHPNKITEEETMMKKTAKKKTVRKPKECILCGNTDPKEIEKTTFFSDPDGKDGIYLEWLCKEGEGCL